MKIAVIGRGTAGCLAAAEVTQCYPGHELFHIYDPNVPIIGVGEGTLPGIPDTLARLTKLPPQVIEDRLAATKKFGVQFEGWGATRGRFVNHFYPQDEAFGYHLSATTLVDLLSDFIDATHISDNVCSVEKHGRKATITFASRSHLEVDLVIDARGFPKALNPDAHVEIPFIPTNHAIIRRTEPGEFIMATRAVARPNGWIFVIPLKSHTSYGYIFNRDVSPIDQVTADFDVFLEDESVASFEERGAIPFPNFVCRQVYDGVIAKVGNAAGFMEPLEATALALIEHQLGMVLSRRLRRPDKLIEKDAVVINRHLLRWSWRYGLFISWHYACGSIYNTPFWKHARECAYPNHRNGVREFGIDCDEQVRVFEQFLDAGVALRDKDKEAPFPRLPTFAGFEVENFADMANGLGFC